jgi:transcriptional regulator with XRE-family HTH domain
MNADMLKAIAQARGLNHSDLARLAGVRRQSVSLWFKKAQKDATHEINLHAQNQRKLAEGLGVTLDELIRPLPLHGDPGKRRIMETEILWDRLYPSLSAFAVALNRGEFPALARLVQAYGLFQAAAIAGEKIFKQFPRYKRHIEPNQRKSWERVWILQKSLGLI